MQTLLSMRLRTGLILGLIIGIGLLLQHAFQRQAGMRDFRRQSTATAANLRDRIRAAPASGAVRSLGISNERLKGVLNGDLPDDMPSLLVSLTGLRERIGADLIYGLDAQGRVRVSTRYDGGKHITGKNFTFRPYFQLAMKGNPVVYPALGTTTLQRGVYYSAPVYTNGPSDGPSPSSPVIGVIVIKMPFDAIDELFSKTSDRCALVSPHGIVFTGSDPDWQFQRISSLAKAGLPTDPSGENPEYGTAFFKARSSDLDLRLNQRHTVWDGRRYVFRTFPVPLNDPSGDWTLLIMRDTAAWYPVEQTLLNLIVLLALAGAILAALYARGRNRWNEAAKIRAIMEAASTYRSVFNAVTDALFVHHAKDGRILDANDSARKLYDCPDGDVPAFDPDHDFPYPSEVAHSVLQAAATGRTQIVTFHTQTRSGRDFWAQAVFRLYSIHGVDRILADVRDITEQREIHNALTASKALLSRQVALRTAQLLQSQKMAAIGKFSERITHDVTNAMARIVGYADMIRQQPQTPDVMETSLREIETAAREMCAMSADLLAFSHPAPLKRTRLDLRRVIRGFESILTLSAPPTVRIVIQTPDYPIWAAVSATHIEQALTHLAQNSFESMTQGGTLTLSLRRGNSDDQPPTGSDHRIAPTALALIEVTDTGAGVAPDHVPEVFDPFFTTKTDNKRRGMGLTSVYIIVNSHQGWVNVVPAGEGGIPGGRVQIWLPIIDDGRDPGLRAGWASHARPPSEPGSEEPLS